MTSAETAVSRAFIRNSMPPNRGRAGGDSRALDYSTLRYEKNRLATFSQWPLNAPVPKERLAKAGFFYKSAPYRVECFSCGGCVDDWEFNEQAMLRHRSLYPQCPFVNDCSDNVPLVQLNTAQLLAPEDSGYGSTSQSSTSSNSHSPASSQGSSQLSTSPRTGFRFPAPETVGSTVATQPPPPHNCNPNPPQSHRTWSDFSFLKRERQRLRTFSGWPLDFVRPDELARAGFFYLQDGDKAQCIFCRGIVGDWELGDVPMTEHSRHFPLCPFVRGLNVGNVRAEEDSEDPGDDEEEPPEDRVHSNGSQQMGRDEIGYRLDFRTHAMPESGLSSSRLTSSHLNVKTPEGTTEPADLAELGIAEYHAPIHPSYATVEARLRSFQFWPPALAQKPLQLAEAGFFYAGVSDHVKCFHCDGGLRNWVPSDDPWTEHARWFSRCGFLRLVKGEDFIQACLRDHPQSTETMAANGTETETNVKRAQFTEQQIEEMMENAICKSAVELGVDREAVKRALKQRLASTGLPFSDVSTILTMAARETGATFPPPPSGGPSGSGSGPGHQRAGSTLSAASSGADSGMDEAQSQDEDMDTQSVSSEPSGSPGMVSTQTSEESTHSTVTNASGSGGETPRVLSPSASGCASMVATPTCGSVQGSLEEEYRRLKEQKLCKVCMDEEVGVVFLPCGHLITCVKCAPSLRDCPLCRQPIRGTVRTYLS